MNFPAIAINSSNANSYYLDTEDYLHSDSFLGAKIECHVGLGLKLN